MNADVKEQIIYAPEEHELQNMSGSQLQFILGNYLYEINTLSMHHNNNLTHVTSIIDRIYELNPEVTSPYDQLELIISMIESFKQSIHCRVPIKIKYSSNFCQWWRDMHAKMDREMTFWNRFCIQPKSIELSKRYHNLFVIKILD